MGRFHKRFNKNPGDRQEPKVGNLLSMVEDCEEMIWIADGPIGIPARKYERKSGTMLLVLSNFLWDKKRRCYSMRVIDSNGDRLHLLFLGTWSLYFQYVTI